MDNKMAKSENKSIGTGLKKRQEIENAGKTMFMWVVIASIAVSICVVTVQFLFQQWSYNNKVLGAKYAAVDTLKKNIENSKKLQEEVNGLVSNEALASVKTNTGDPNTKSVLDALPSRFDATALATSLQQAILSRSGVSIDSISVPADQAADGTTADGSVPVASPDAKPQEMPFNIAVSGSYDKIRSMLLDLERTIRPIKVTDITLEGDDTAMTATVSAVTYYQPAKSASIKQEVVK